MMRKSNCTICAKSSRGPFVMLMYPNGYSQTACMDCLKRILKEEDEKTTAI